MVSIDVGEIYRKAFGVELFDTIVFPNIEKNIPDKAPATSYLRTPVYMPVTLKGGTYNRLNKGKIETVTLADLRLPDTTLCDFQRQKNLIETPINGGKGTVTEMWAFEDWQIKIYGLIYPTDVDMKTQLQRLLEFEDITDAVEVKSDFFETLKISQIIIKSIELPQLKGQQNVRPFNLVCKSNEPVELII